MPDNLPPTASKLRFPICWLCDEPPPPPPDLSEWIPTTCPLEFVSMTFPPKPLEDPPLLLLIYGPFPCIWNAFSDNKLET